MDVFKQLLGRLHPLLVHLPIGFIMVGLLLQWYDRKSGENKKTIGLIYLWAGITAVLTCITGYLQYVGEGYAFNSVKWHLWLGIATAVFSFLMFFKYQEPTKIRLFRRVPLGVFLGGILLLISFTGHLGGSITHGDDYLVEPLPNKVKSALGFDTFEEKEIALNEQLWQDALVYDDVIKPILNNNCVSCHNPKKSKGELQLHTVDDILKGGENGAVLVTNNAEQSELFLRMMLPKEDEHHMPPEGKTQPSKEEVRLIGAWIDAGHPFDKSIGETALEKSLFETFFVKKKDNDYPDVEVIAASQDSILAIEKTGVHIDPISKATNFLSVSCINKPLFSDLDFESLLPIKNQIAKLDLGGTQVTDSVFAKLSLLPNLTILKLDNTAITGNTIEKITALEHLKHINLTSSKFETPHLEKLADLKNLLKVYVYGSKVDPKGIRSLKDGQIIIDYGDYQLPSIASDSIIY